MKNDGNFTQSGVYLEDVPFVLARPINNFDGGKPTATTEWEVANLTLITKNEYGDMDPAPIKAFEDGYYSIVSWDSVTGAGATFNPAWVATKTEVSETVDGNVIKTRTEGQLNISGLDVEVLYSLAEVDAPNVTTKQYAKIDPFTFKLYAQMNTENTEYTGKLSNATSDEAITSGESFTFAKPVQIIDKFEGTPAGDDDGSAKTLVANFKYTDLPSTGGVGTVWFYILGAGGVGLAGVLFFLSKKKVTK